MKLKALLTLALGASLASAASADVHPNTQRGFVADKSFQMGELDAINTFTGSVTMTIPIGQTYSLAGGLSYQLILSYNTNVWDFQEAGCTNGSYTIANPRSTGNAGLGWIIGLGRLLSPTHAQNTSGSWLYLSPDGGEHVFYDTLHPNEQPTAGVGYTRDGSYLRRNARTVTFPDGSTHVFDTQGRITRMRSRYTDPLGLEGYANWVRIDYDQPAVNQWKITDSAGRTHILTFANDPNSSGTKRISSVALSGVSANFVFTYASRTIPRAKPHFVPPTAEGCPIPSTTVPVSLLTEIKLPDNSTISMAPTDYFSNTALDVEWQGFLTAYTLPTKGRVEFTYQAYEFPQQVNPGQGGGPRHRDRTGGVATRTMKNGSTGLGTWTYQTALTPEAPFVPLRELVNTISTPPHDGGSDPRFSKIESYFSVFNQNSADGDWTRQQYAQPISHKWKDEDPLTPNALVPRRSTRIFDCVNASSCTLFSETYVRFEQDNVSAVSGTEAQNSNRRLQHSRTYHATDPNGAPVRVYSEETNSNFDGFGHYRQSVIGGNFNTGGNSRSSFVNYTPDASTWILGTFSEQSTTENGNTAKSETCFEASTGFLLRKRVIASANGSRGGNDVVTTYARDIRGNAIEHRMYGGDSAGLGTGSLCTLSLPAERYRIDHGYDSDQGVLISSQLKDAGGGTPGALNFKTYDVDVDPLRGLVTRSRDSAGKWTDFSYDVLGRRTLVTPQNDACTAYTYTNATGTSGNARATVTIEQKARISGCGAALTTQKARFDGFGRLESEERSLPGPTGSGVVTSYRNTTYTPVGWLRTRTEWDSTVFPATQTRYQGYDPLGRAVIIELPDGHQLRNVWTGVRKVDRRTKAIGTTTPITRSSEFFDRQGRLVWVKEFSGTNGTQVQTTYGYDVGNRLVSVSTPANIPITPDPGAAEVSITQTRTFTYDNRGFLLAENHPEKQANPYPNGNDVDYLDYDPLGNPGRKIDGGNDLSYLFDRAGRLTQVKETGTSGAVLKQWTYGSSSTVCGACLGKLYQATRYNIIRNPLAPPNYDFVSFPVTETYDYDGEQGRISSRETLLGSDNRFTQSFTFDDLGNLATQTYPRCVGSLVDCEEDTNTPANPRIIAYGYNQGVLTSISNSQGTPSIGTNTLGYHPNGMLALVDHANGLDENIGLTADRMPRPASITAQTSATNTLWRTGAYAYDPLGNILSMGPNLSNFTEVFSYDSVDRLKEATLYVPTGNPIGTTHEYRKQRFTYEAFGNLRKIETQIGNAGAAWTAQTISVDSSNNRLTTANYDPSGNQLNAVGGGIYNYDKLGMIRAVNQISSDWTTYLYTADDERVASIYFTNGLPTLQETFTLRGLGNEVLVEYRDVGGTQGTWTLAKEYVYRNGQLLASIAPSPEGVRHLALDHLGTPRLATDGMGLKVALHTYYPFGGEATATTQDSERLKFTGHERDFLGTGGTTDDLDYMHARHYSPLVGRFLSTDRVLGSLGVPQSWNRYSYSFNRPTSFVDRTGNWGTYAAIWQFLVDHGSISVSGDVGSGPGVSTSIEVLPNFGVITISGGGGIGSGVSGTADLTFGEVTSPMLTASASGGQGWGGHGDVSVDLDGNAAGTIGVGYGLGFGATLTTQLFSGYFGDLYHLLFYDWLAVSICGDGNGCSVAYEWRVKPFDQMNTISPVYIPTRYDGGLEELIDWITYLGRPPHTDLFNAGHLCIEGVCSANLSPPRR